jgi:hypothetical protein
MLAHSLPRCDGFVADDLGGSGARHGVCEKPQSASPPQPPDAVQLAVRDAQALPQLHADFPAACLHAELLQ